MLRSFLARLADRTQLAILASIAAVLACAVPVFAANSFDSSNTGDALGDVTVNKPAGLAVGDVMIASVAFYGPSSTTITAAGWTEIDRVAHTQPNPDLTLVTFWNEADAGDVAASSFTFDLSTDARGFGGIARYDDVIVTSGTPVAANVTNPVNDDNPGASTSLNASSVNTTEPGQYVTAIYALATGNTITTGPSGMTALYNNGRTTGTDPGRLVAYDVTQATATASGTKTATAASTRYISHTIALKTEPTKLGFGTPSREGVVDGCIGPITVQTQNTAGGATKPQVETQVELQLTDGTGSFFSDSGCGTALTSDDRKIGTGATGFTFYYKPSARGDGVHTIAASAPATTLTQASQDETVKLAQHITFAQPASPQTYGESFDIGSATSDSGLTVVVTPSGGCSLVGTTATMNSGTTDCTLTATQAGDADYGPADPVVRTVNAALRPLSVTADPNSKIYNNGGADPDLTFTITSGTLAFSDTFDVMRAVGENVDEGPYAITPDFPAASNYNLSYTGANFTITSRPLTMNANDVSKTYGDADPTCCATLTGFATGHNNRNQAGVGGTESCSRVGTQQNVGVYTDVMSCTQGTLTSDHDNYSFVTGTPGDLTINQKQLTVDANPASKTYGDADPAFNATLTGFAFGENRTTGGVTGSESCLRAGSQEDAATYPNEISCGIGSLTASNYSFTPGSTADFTINPRAAHASFTIADKPYDQTDDAQILTTTLTNRASFDTNTELNMTGAPGAAHFSDANAGTNKTVTVDQGTLALQGTKLANYTFVVDDGTADINPKPVDGSFTAADKVYNGNTLTTVLTRSVDAADVLAGDTVALTGGTANFDTADVGTNKPVTLTGAGTSNPNYTVGTIAQAAADITKRNVTGHFTAADKDFDGTTAARVTSRSLTNAITGDSVSLTGGTATFGNANPGNDKTVTLSGATLGGADAGNYNLASVATTTADIRREPGGSTPPPKDVTKDAEKALGGDVEELPFDLKGLGYAFAPADLKNPLKVGKKAIKLFAIGDCDDPCTVKAKKTLVLTGTADGASAAATRKIKLKTQNMSLAADEFGVVKLKKLTRKQRKAIRKAQKTKLVVKTTLTSAGESVTFKKKYGLKLKK